MKKNEGKNKFVKYRDRILKKPSILSLSLFLKERVKNYKETAKTIDPSRKVTTKEALDAWALERYFENKKVPEGVLYKQSKIIEGIVDKKIKNKQYTKKELAFFQKMMSKKSFNKKFNEGYDRYVRNHLAYMAKKEYDDLPVNERSNSKKEYVANFIKEKIEDNQYLESMQLDEGSFSKYIKKIALITNFAKDYRDFQRVDVKCKTTFFIRSFLKEKNRLKGNVKWNKTAREKLDASFVYYFKEEEGEKGKDKKNKAYYVKKKDKNEHPELEKESSYVYRKVFCKKNIKKAFIYGLAGVFFIPRLDAWILNYRVSKMDPTEFKTEYVLPSEEVSRTEDGKIIEFPVVDTELIKAQDYLNQKMIKDFKTYGIELEKIDEMIGIYEFDRSHESQGKRKILEVLVKSGEDIYSLQYLKEGEFTINSSRNETGTISSFNSIIKKASLYGASKIDDEKQKIIDKIDSSIFVGDVYNYTNSSGTTDYRIPVYNENDYNETECKVFSISEKDITSINDSLYLKLIDYLDDESFKAEETQKMNEKFKPVLDAYDMANLHRENQPIIEK